MAKQLYYILKENTSERINTRSGEPLIIQEEIIDDTIQDLQQRIPGIGRLNAIPLQEYYEAYYVPAIQAKRQALKILDEDKDLVND